MSHERTEVHTPLDSIFHWEYDVKFPQMDRLYENAKRDQWNVSTALDWERPIAPEVLDLSMMPLCQTEIYKSHGDDDKLKFARKLAAWRLSQFLHGEQGALMVCGQLVDAVPDLDAKMNAAAQVFDEARHVEGFRKYILKLDRIYPIDPTLERLLRGIMEHDRWEPKYVGMQIVAEGLAIAAFRFMHRETKDALLRDLLELIMKDESRHIGFGMLALRDAVTKLKGKEKKDLEEFAFAACDMMVTKKVNGELKDGFLSDRQVLGEFGISMKDIEAEIERNPQWHEAEKALERQLHSFLFVDTIIPCLRQLDLINDHTESWYRQLGVMDLASAA
ncbi:MAG TPA: ferritin-like domain-containing protein [Candidatus Binataceae bacterium]|nr:ferritin-like domain-containing protein [Candidatus Binataceae bacterium]